MPIIVSHKYKQLVVPPHEGVTNMFGGAPVLPCGNIMVPHGIRETLMLRHLGFQVPNPMTLHYDWRGGTPYAVQRATCEMLVEHPRAYVLNGMGTGKTKAALWAWDYLHSVGLAKSLLVVAPLSTLNFVWAREVFSTLPGKTVAILHGTRQERLDRLGRGADIYVINHDGVKVVAEALAARGDIDTLVLDELAVYRNNSERSKLIRKVAARFSIVWGLTGAPMPNEPTDVWGQCKIITPTSVPKYESTARQLLMDKRGPYTWVPKPDAVDRAFSWMQPSVRYSLDDVLELPPMIPSTEDVELSKEQDATYKKMAAAMHALVQQKQITAVNAGVAMNKLLQISGGWVYTINPEFVSLNPVKRVVRLAELIQGAEHKVLVAVPYRHMLEGISKILSDKTINLDHEVVHGQTKNRDDIFNRFQNTDRPKTLLCHPECVAHGLTLTAADTVIWYTPITSLDIYDQFIARVRRIGQMHKQRLIHLQSTPVEKKIYRMLRQHQKMQAAFLELVENATAEAD